MRYEDLFDIERRPGAGIALWTDAAERQLGGVRDAHSRHRLHASPNREEQRDDPGAESDPHAEVYFLALAVRRVVLFCELLAEHADDPRLRDALAQFNEAAPE